MHRKIERRLKFATLLLVVSGYLALTTTFDYGADILLVPLGAIALMPLGEWIDRRFPVYRAITNGVIVAFVAGAFLILRRFTLLDAVVALVMFIQVYSLLHRKTVRDYIHLFLMSFFLVLAATAMAPRADIAAVFLLFLVSLTWGMVLLEMFAAGRGQAQAPHARPQWRSAAGDLVPRRTLSLFDARLTALVMLLAAGVLGLSAVVFAVGPRTEAGIFGATRSIEPPTTGLSSSVEFDTGGPLQSTGAPVMRVQFPGEPGGVFLGPMLWRVTALDAYTGGGWEHRGMVTGGYDTDEKRRLKSDWRLASREGLDRPAGKWHGGEWPKVSYEIFLDRPPQTAVPLLQLVTQVMPGPENATVQFRWDAANDFSVSMRTRGENGVALSAISEVMQPTLQQLSAAGADASLSLAPEDFARLTYQDLLPETLELVRRVTGDAATTAGKVRALEVYLNGRDFEYSRVVPVLPSQNPIDAFILRERKGHCQLFASALALMVRSLGVPARVVSGYRGAMWDRADQSYTVTEDMAHLWTEVYFPEIGWIAFDPSPIDAEGEQTTFGIVTRAYSRYVLKARLLWLRNVVAFEQRQGGESLRDLGARVFRFGGETWDKLQTRQRRVSIGGGMREILVVLGSIAALVVLVWRGIAGRSPATRRRATLSRDQRRALRLYRRIQRRLRGLGLRCEGGTAEELAGAAASLSLNDREAVPAAVAIYNGARFGRRALGAGELDAWNRRIARLNFAGRGARRAPAD